MSAAKLFFRGLRVVLGPFMLLGEYVARPRGLVRPAEVQARIARECESLTLYQFRTCPFCIKVRQELRRLSLPVATRDAQHPGAGRDELLAGGGRVMVPCLKVVAADGRTEWIYESGRIVDYLRQRFG